jgi:hypothetical protein
MYTNFWLESLKGKHHLEESGVDDMTVLKWITKKQGGKLGNAFIRLKMGTSCRLF